MRTRPMSFFFALTLLFGVTIDRSWAQAQEQFDTTTAALPDEMGARAGATNAVEANGAGKSTGSGVGSRNQVSERSSNCLFETENLSPAISNIVRIACPQSLSMSQVEYCSCVRTFTTNNIPEVHLISARDSMKRIGYQYLLEKWADSFGGQLLAVASLQGKAVASEARMPDSCNAGQILTELQAKLESSSCGSSIDDKAGFRSALGAVFRLNGVNQNIFASIRERGTQVGSSSALLASIERSDRFYPEPNTNQPGIRTFVDCMPAANKRAYALLPVEFPQGSFARRDETVAEGVTRRSKALDDALRILNIVKENGVAGDDMYSPEIRSIMMIFPGADLMLKSGDMTKIKWMADKLHGFVKRLKEEPAYRRIGEARASKEAMRIMRDDVDSVQRALTAELAAMNGGVGDGALTNQVAYACTTMKEDLMNIACSPSNFIASSTFMVAAFADASNKGNRVYGQGRSPARYANCVEGDNAEGRDAYACLAYSRAQCDKISERINSAQAVPGNLQTLGNMNLEDADSLKEIRAEAVFDRNLLADEEGVVHLMCEGFNNQLRTKTCVDDYRSSFSDRSEAYRRCASQDGRFEAYLNSPEGRRDPRAQAVADGTFASPGLAPSPSRRESFDDFGDGVLAAETAAPVVNTLGTSNLTGAIRSAASQFGSNTIVGGVTAPLDIDAPTSTTTAASAEVRDIQRSINAQDTQIEAVDAQIAGLGSSPEADATRRELEALRAEMKAVRDELLASRSAAEARVNGTEVAARGDEEGEEAGDRRVVSGSGRGGISRGPASESFNISSGGGRSASDAVGSNEFRQASVDSTFGSTAATRGAVIRDSQGLPSVQSADPNNRIALRVGDQSYAVKDVETVVVPAGTPANDQTIRALILQAKDRILLDAEQRAMVEIWDDNSKSSRVVYVRINGLQVEFLELNAETAMPQVRSTLADLQSRLSAGRGAASEEN